MVTTREIAKKVIRVYYGSSFNFRITCSTTIGVRPVADPRPTLCWRAESAGKAAQVHVGRLLPNLQIDWEFKL